MLCEDYPSLFDTAKVRNDFELCKQIPDFNITLTKRQPLKFKLGKLFLDKFCNNIVNELTKHVTAYRNIASLSTINIVVEFTTKFIQGFFEQVHVMTKVLFSCPRIKRV